MYMAKKVRLYPTKEQEELLWKHINCCRWIWNELLTLEKNSYAETGKFIWEMELRRKVTEIRNLPENTFLTEVSNNSLRLTAKVLVKGIEKCVRKDREIRLNFPKYKYKRNNRQTYPVRAERFYFKDENVCQIEKVGKVKYKGRVDVPFGRDKQKFNILSVIHDYKGRWFLGYVVNYENQEFTNKQPKSMGIDLGTRKLATISFGENSIIYANINKQEKELDKETLQKEKAVSYIDIANTRKKILSVQKRLNHYRRELERRRTLIDEKHSKNYYRTLRKTHYLYAKLTNIRENYIHQIVHELIFMKPERIVMEDLKIKNMIKQHRIAKDILNAKWRFFRNCVEFKCKVYEISFVLADRLFPSSKLCSQCGHKHTHLGSKEIYVCENCGIVIDRDINASLNLMNYSA